MKPQPLITVYDFPLISEWSENVLGLCGGHGGDDYERMIHGDHIVLQLHPWDTQERLHLKDPSVPVGNGSILWFQADQFDKMVAKAQADEAKVLEVPQINV